MKKKMVILAGAIALLISMLSAGTAFADEHVGICPTRFGIKPSDLTLVNAALDPAVDVNGDGYICDLVFVPQGQGTFSTIYVDNNIKADIP